MLTAKGQVADRVKGLKTGAGDYPVKPFNSDELLARVTALLRRIHKADLKPVMRIEFGNVVAEFISERTVDVQVVWLRQKLEDNPQSPKHIITVRDEGYRFEN
ncbi:MAG: DNA-binding response regulator [Verrucomicrobiales bacterium]|nr:DNA-binding response regulator [Verrucomicrobiales bacterium]